MKEKIRWLMGIFCLLSLGSGCQLHLPSAENAYQFYYVNDYSSTGEALIGVTRYLADKQGDISAKTLLEAHMNYGKEADVRSPYPSGTTLYRVEEEGSLAQVFFSPEYGELAGIDKTVADFAVVETLCQLARFDTVRIFVASETQGERELLQTEDRMLLS